MKTKLTLSALMACLIVGNVGFAAPMYYHKAVLGTNTDDINIVSTQNEGGIVLRSDKGASLTGNNINIDLKSKGTVGVVAGTSYTSNPILNLGDKDSTDIININVVDTSTSESPDFARGLWATGTNTEDWFYGDYSGKLNVNGKSLIITGYSENGAVYGIHAQNNTTNEQNTDNLATININTDNTYIDVSAGENAKGQGSAIVAMSQGIININSNLEVYSDEAIVARGGGVVNINTESQKTTKLNGDIKFAYDGPSSGTAVDAKVKVNLTGADSYWNGNSSVSEGTPVEKDDVTGFTLILADNARWITDADSFVNNLNLDGGIINAVGGEEQTITVQNFTGNGSVNMQTTVEGDKYSTAKLELGKDPNGSNTPGSVTGNLNVNFIGITADDVKDAKSAMEQLVSGIKVNGTQENFNASANVKEGLLNGSISSEFNNDSTLVEGSLHQNSSTTTMDNMRDIASVALIAWRQEDSTLSQRLGELRNSEGDQGIWVRMNRGEFEYGGAFKNQYNFFQLGYDKAYGDWHYGAAISHNDGQTTYSDGSGDNSSTSLSLYGTWLGDKGHYADIVLKEGRLSNEFENYAEAGYTKGDYDAWGTSISGEYGRKIDFKDGWFVTPQAQMTYMYITGEDYTTNNGISVSQDSMQSVVGRIGFEVGKEINDFGSIYAKASLLHEFAGDADTYLSMNGISNSYTQDLSDTWYEAGLGLNYRTSENTYVYADVVKTYGGDIETPWQWIVGVRYSF